MNWTPHSLKATVFAGPSDICRFIMILCNHNWIVFCSVLANKGSVLETLMICILLVKHINLYDWKCVLLSVQLNWIPLSKMQLFERAQQNVIKHSASLDIIVCLYFRIMAVTLRYSQRYIQPLKFYYIESEASLLVAMKPRYNSVVCWHKYMFRVYVWWDPCSNNKVHLFSLLRCIVCLVSLFVLL